MRKHFVIVALEGAGNGLGDLNGVHSTAEGISDPPYGPVHRIDSDNQDEYDKDCALQHMAKRQTSARLTHNGSVANCSKLLIAKIQQLAFSTKRQKESVPKLFFVACCFSLSFFDLAAAHGQMQGPPVFPVAPLPVRAEVELPTLSYVTQVKDGVKESSATPAQQQSSADQVKAAEKQRLLGIMPAFNTVPGGVAPPLTSSQKFDLWFHSSVDPFTFGIAAVDAGIEQAEDTYPEYRQGIEGYAKRFGASYADSVDGNFWGNAVLPSLLHQDPRYFRLGHGSAKRRLGYALLSTVRCKGDNGRWQPSYSNIAGNLIGGAISNVYYPASDRGAGLTLERGFTVTAEGALGSLAFEFYPDLVQYIKHRHRGSSAKSPAPPS